MPCFLVYLLALGLSFSCFRSAGMASADLRATLRPGGTRARKQARNRTEHRKTRMNFVWCSAFPQLHNRRGQPSRSVQVRRPPQKTAQQRQKPHPFKRASLQPRHVSRGARRITTGDTNVQETLEEEAPKQNRFTKTQVSAFAVQEAGHRNISLAAHFSLLQKGTREQGNGKAPKQP